VIPKETKSHPNCRTAETHVHVLSCLHPGTKHGATPSLPFARGKKRSSVCCRRTQATKVAPLVWSASSASSSTVPNCHFRASPCQHHFAFLLFHITINLLSSSSTKIPFIAPSHRTTSPNLPSRHPDCITRPTTSDHVCHHRKISREYSAC
jgi:hypothetical protein